MWGVSTKTFANTEFALSVLFVPIGGSISCDVPKIAIGFKGKLLLRHPLSKACLSIGIGHFYRGKGGCSTDSLRCHRKHSATLSFDRRLAIPGGYFGR